MTSRRDDNGTVAAAHTGSESLHAQEPPFDNSHDIWAAHNDGLGPPYSTAVGDNTLGGAQSSFHPSDMNENEHALGTYSWYPESATPGSYMADQYVDHSEFLTPSFGDTLQEPFDILNLNIRDDDDAEVPGRSSSDQVHASTLTDAQPAGELASAQEDSAFISDMTESSQNTQLLSPELTNPSTPVNDHTTSPNSVYAGRQGSRSHHGRVPLPGQQGEINGTNTARLTVETTGLQTDSGQSPSQIHQRTPSIQMHPPVDNTDSDMRTGFDPDQRGEEVIPSLEDMEEARQLEVNRHNVYQWLDESDIGSDAEKSSSLKPRKAAGRRLRAKSASDMNLNQGISDANIPGPFIYIKEDDIDDDEEEEDEDYDAEDEELDSSPINDYQQTAEEVPKPPDDLNADEAPDSANITQRPPWVDVPTAGSSQAEGNQPYNSNAAMAMFQRRAKELDRVSIAATIGSRRKSFSDMGSIYGGPDSRRNSIMMNDHAPVPKSAASARRPTLFNRVMPKRALSNSRKRKESEPTAKPGSPEAFHARKGSQGSLKTERTGNLGQSKSPAGDRNNATSPISAISLTPTSPFKAISGAIRRSRSRSELSNTAGLGEMLAKQGGPPMLSLPKGSPEEALAQATRNTPVRSVSKADNNDDDSDDDDDSSPVSANIAMNLKVRNDHIIPTHEGFKLQVKTLNPRLEPYMIERVAAEQLKRYKRLLDNRLRHAKIGNKCSSGKFCSLQGGIPEYLPPRNSGKGSEAQAVIFYITPPQDTHGEELEPGDDSSTVMANFPDGIPIPPVDRLPARFECTLCFQVKSISKPSDWTKHVHEDLQPFTCTFPDCSQPKSFKRKADWVRHENELHRQLEKWVCSLPECPKRECYRKNNFVHHLGREHHLDQRSQGGRTAVPRLVQECRVWNNKQPGEEPCRFCHNLCPKWKILNVHLAKHLEQISMPLFPLVDSMAGKYPHAQRPLGIPDAAPVDMSQASPFEEQMMVQGPVTTNWAPPYYDNISVQAGNGSHGGLSDTSSPPAAAEYYRYQTNPNTTSMSIPSNAIQSHSALQRQYTGNQMLSPNGSTSAVDGRYSTSPNTYPPANISPRHANPQVMPNAYLTSDLYTTSPVDGPILPSSTQEFTHTGMSVTYPPVSAAYTGEPDSTQFYASTTDQMQYDQIPNNVAAYGHGGMQFSSHYMQGATGGFQDDQQLDNQHGQQQTQQRAPQGNHFFY